MTSQPCVGIVAGSGLDLRDLLDEVAEEYAFTKFSRLEAAGIAGHDGRFLLGRCGHTPAILQLGRLHFYEGRGYEAVTRAVDVMRDFGAQAIIYTNAAGGLDRAMEPGNLMAVDRVLLWPYRQWSPQPEALEPDFVVGGCETTGTYYWVHGPCYETRAEIRALQTLGGNAVGMSTAAEIHRAQALGIQTAAVSCITNTCWRPRALTHEHVLQTARATSARLRAVLRNAIAREDPLPRVPPANTNARES